LIGHVGVSGTNWASLDLDDGSWQLTWFSRQTLTA